LLRNVAAGFGIEVAPEGPARDVDPWSMSISRLAFALDRFRLASRSGPVGEQDDEIDGELLTSLSAAYEEQLREQGAVDYPAMLKLPLQLFRMEPRTLRLMQDAYRFVTADEFQDTTRTQFKLLEQIVDHHRNLAVVGDPKQCFPPGTAVQTPNGSVPIESIQDGDIVLAATGSGATGTTLAQSTIRREFDGELVQITLKSGVVLRLTPDHMC